MEVDAPPQPPTTPSDHGAVDASLALLTALARDSSRPAEINYDLTYLMASDPGFDKSRFASEASLRAAAEEVTQQLVGKIFALPTEKTPDGALGKLALLPDLSAAVLRLPREKPIPKASTQLTKWKQFAMENKIRKTDRSKLVWDEQAGEFRRRYGYKRVGSELTDEPWLVELKEGQGMDGVDPRTAMKGEKRARTMKQNKRERSNRKKLGLPSSLAIASQSHPKKATVIDAYGKARFSTASMGKFDPVLEGAPSRLRVAGASAKPKESERNKRHATTTAGAGEKVRTMKVLERMLAKRPVVDTDRAANAAIRAAQKSSGTGPKARAGGSSGGSRKKKQR